MQNRRDFLKKAGIHSAGLALLPFFPDSWNVEEKISIPDWSENDDFWYQIQQSYTSSRSLLNFNNGGVSPQPKYVQEAFELYNRISNESPSYEMWRVLEPRRVNIRRDLANMLDCSHDELVINRNTTEALDTVIFGLDIEKGDEIVLTRYDYPNMRNAWEQRSKRDGVKLNYIPITLPDDSDEKIVEAFVNAVNSKTKLVHITHMVNYNGQILPAKEITKAVKEKNPNVFVMLDGAHTFAHFPFKLSDIGCDFFGTSLHKWLSAPFGSGLMYITKEHIDKIWPFFPTDAREDNDITKFEAMGTRSVPTEIAVAQAILFHQSIGDQRKWERLSELTSSWVNEFKDNERFVAYKNNTNGSLFTFGIDGLNGKEITAHLQREYKIITSPIEHENLNGCRISPHVYTSFNDIDKLKEGINSLIKK